MQPESSRKRSPMILWSQMFEPAGTLKTAVSARGSNTGGPSKVLTEIGSETQCNSNRDSLSVGLGRVTDLH